MGAVISVENLRKNHGEIEALKGVSFEVAESQLTAVIGPSGCGKSTLLRCLNGLELFDSGRVRVDGITLERHNEAATRKFNSQLRELREGVGMVFQSFNLFPHLTVLENAVLAPTVVKKLSKAEAERTAAAGLRRSGNLLLTFSPQAGPAPSCRASEIQRPPQGGRLRGARHANSFLECAHTRLRA